MPKFGRWIWDRAQQRMVPADEYHARKSEGVAVSDLPRPMVISDTLDRPLKNMVDGQMYDSKAAMRRVYKDRGYVEIGNEVQKPKAPFKPDRKAIRHAVRKAASQVGLGHLT